MICPLHGPVWREDLGYILDKYDRWSKYIPEEPGVVLAYASMYGNTENAVDLLAGKLAQRGIANLSVFDVSKTHPSEIIAEMFRLSHMVLASPTYNMGIYYGMHGLLHEMAALNLQNRKVAIIGNGSWAPAAANLMKKQVEGMKNMALVCEPLEIRSALKRSKCPMWMQWWMRFVPPWKRYKSLFIVPSRQKSSAGSFVFFLKSTGLEMDGLFVCIPYNK